MLIASFDVGASSTKFAVSDEEGRIILRGIGPHGNPFAIGIDKVVERIHKMYIKVVDNISRDIDIAIFGLTGYSIPLISALRKKFNTCNCEIIVLDDKVFTLESALGGKDCVVVYAGTGSFVITRDPSGNIVTSGNKGYLLGDEGGGFYISHKAIKLFIRSLDGREESSDFTEEIGKSLLKIYKADTIDELFYKLYSRKIDVGKIASLTPIVMKFAEKGNIYAIKILEDAIGELALMIYAVTSKVDLFNKSFLLVYSGNVFSAPVFVRMFKEKIGKVFPHAVIREPLFPPVIGGIIIGLKRLQNTIPERLLENINSTYSSTYVLYLQR
jgi:N-acetylglucosamine kinase-like BadF-type ATPase